MGKSRASKEDMNNVMVKTMGMVMPAMKENSILHKTAATKKKLPKPKPKIRMRKKKSNTKPKIIPKPKAEDDMSQYDDLGR